MPKTISELSHKQIINNSCMANVLSLALRSRCPDTITEDHDRARLELFLQQELSGKVGKEPTRETLHAFNEKYMPYNNGEPLFYESSTKSSSEEPNLTEDEVKKTLINNQTSYMLIIGTRAGSHIIYLYLDENSTPRLFDPAAEKTHVEFLGFDKVDNFSDLLIQLNLSDNVRAPFQ